MSRMLRAVLAIAVGVGVCAVPAISLAEQPTPIAPEGVTRLEAGAGDAKVRVQITTYAGGTKEAAARRLRAVTGISRVSLVQDIEIHVGKRKVFVPLSVFCDLTELREGRLRGGTKTSILALAGGDASESYVVTIEFDKEMVRRRTLASALAPETPTQETKYRLIVVGKE